MDLIAELKRDFGSHLNADLYDWDFAASYGEIMTGLHASTFINSNRDIAKHPKPILLPVPWRDKAKEQDVSPEEKARLRAVLIKHSAFATRPEEEPRD